MKWPKSISPFDVVIIPSISKNDKSQYEKAEKICGEFKLKIKFEIKLEKWSYDFFLGKNNTFYISKDQWQGDDIEKFVQKFNKDIFLDRKFIFNKRYLKKTKN